MARRRYLSTKISNDRAVNDLIAQYGDFAGLLYTWMIPHAEDDATINGDPFYILTEVIPGRRDKSEADVTAAIDGMVALGLLERLDGDLLGFPTGPFYGYQSYVKQESRRRESAEETDDSGEQRKTPENIVARALPPVSFSPPVSPSPRENEAGAVAPRRKRPRSAAQSERDVLTEAIGRAWRPDKDWHDLTKTEQQTCGRCSAEIHGVRGSPEQVAAARAAWDASPKWREMTFTPDALKKHWGELTALASQNGSGYAPNSRRAELERELQEALGPLSITRPVTGGQVRAAG